jgi:hypothetical protein
MANAEQVRDRVRDELARVNDPQLVAKISALLVEPYPVERPWDYGKPDRYECWTVLEHVPSNTAIAFCEGGFGPKCPWGLVGISGSYMGMGMDSSWFVRLEDAFKDSYAAGS